MPLIIVPADEVKEGEPRWWVVELFMDDARRSVESGAPLGHLHLEAADLFTRIFGSAPTHAIVDRPALTHPTGEPHVEPPRAWEVIKATGEHLHILVGDDAEGRARSVAALHQSQGGGAIAIPLFREVDAPVAAAVRAHVAGDGLDLGTLLDRVRALKEALADAMTRGVDDIASRGRWTSLLDRASLTPPAPKTEET